MSTTQGLLVLDGGAHAGAVIPGALLWHQHNLGVNISLALQLQQQRNMRRLMLHDFLNMRDTASSLLPPIFSLKRALFGGLVDQLPVMQRLVKKYGYEPQDDLAVVAFDLETKKLFVFEGDYDLPTALAASCSPWPAARPVEYRDSSRKVHYLVDAAAYLLHKERISPERTSVILRLFDVSRRRPDSDEYAARIGYPRTKVVRRVTPPEYLRYSQHGYDAMEQALRPVVDAGSFAPITSWTYAGISIGSLMATTLCNTRVVDCASA